MRRASVRVAAGGGGRPRSPWVPPRGGAPPAAVATVEAVVERLEVDVRRVHEGEELRPRLRVHVAGGDGDRADAPLPAGAGGAPGGAARDAGGGGGGGRGPRP